MGAVHHTRTFYQTANMGAPGRLGLAPHKAQFVVPFPVLARVAGAVSDAGNDRITAAAYQHHLPSVGTYW